MKLMVASPATVEWVSAPLLDSVHCVEVELAETGGLACKRVGLHSNLRLPT